MHSKLEKKMVNQLKLSCARLSTSFRFPLSKLSIQASSSENFLLFNFSTFELNQTDFQLNSCWDSDDFNHLQLIAMDLQLISSCFYDPWC